MWKNKQEATNMPAERHLLTALLLASITLRAQTPQSPASHEMSHADHMQHHFDPEQSAKQFDDPARDAWQMPDKVIAALHLKLGQTVADIGAGTGYFSVRLARSEAAPKVYAVDIEPGMVSYVRDRAAKEGLKNIIAVQATEDSANLPEPVDAILIVDTYHHIGNREVYFRKLAKSLKPGGRLAIIDFKPDSPEGPPKEFRFPPEKFKAELAKAGYILSEQLDFLPRQQFLIFIVGQPSRLQPAFNR
jgi:cyclopropane fatty-acyl-phospholipid synthase-like methyltransferase